MMKSLHLVIGFLAKNEQSYFMISTNVVYAVDVWSDELEDEHDVVPFIQVLLFILLNSCRYLLLLLCLFLHFLNISLLGNLKLLELTHLSMLSVK